MRKPITAWMLLAFVALFPAAVIAQPMPRCAFDSVRVEFRGSAVEQARCLMTPVGVAARLGTTPARLGDVLEERVGRQVTINRAALRALLFESGLNDLVGTLDFPVSQTAQARRARYFVLHDTSQKQLSGAFPPDDDARLNRLGFRHRIKVMVNGKVKYKDGGWVAHAFVNRRGEVFMGYDFRQAWPATKLERRLGAPARGRFLHVEHNQARISDTTIAADNDRIASDPGLTVAQYERSTLLYVVASARAGLWLIPAFHAVVDNGIAGGHDDPQKFDRAAWEAALVRHVARVEVARPIASVTTPATAQPPLRASLYYTALESDYPGAASAMLRTRGGTLLARVSLAFKRAAEIEGSGKLSDGRVINVDGSFGGERAWRVTANAFGLDAIGCALVPFRSAAVDRGVVPMRTRLFAPETVGMILPDGSRHDGIWYAVDVGSAITGDRIDLFVGAGRAAMSMPRNHGIGHLQALRVERRGTLQGCPVA